jgi:UDP-N-acetylglucosamine--N-acetylmuramyl-(pentapeptide) pyrophosphoryl-undecaprenol N-acetylglucosamine transferase
VSRTKAIAPKRVLLVGGGTAGHVEPALAVGRWLTQADSSLQIEFIGTKFGIEKELVPSAGFPLRCIAKVPLPRKLGAPLFTFPFKFLVSLVQALQIVHGADLVIGFGGYVSASAYLAAKLSGIPIIIHEANALPGWSNKLGARFASAVAVAFPSVLQKYPSWKSAIVTGMPIRESIHALASSNQDSLKTKRGEILTSMGFNPALPVVLVFGGSQGSTSMNMAVHDYARSVEANRIQFIHAVGMKNSLPVATSNYRPLSYIYEMADMYLAADLVIARSGAVTCAELEAVHKYAVLVPLPIGNGEQEANAEILLHDGAAVMCKNSDFTAEWLKKNCESALATAQTFNQSLRSHSVANADSRIGEIALELMRAKTA